MNRLGGYLFLYGSITILFKLAGENGVLIRWIDTWGEDVGWFLRIGILIAGIAILWDEKREAAKRQGARSGLGSDREP